MLINNKWWYSRRIIMNDGDRIYYYLYLQTFHCVTTHTRMEQPSETSYSQNQQFYKKNFRNITSIQLLMYTTFKTWSNLENVLNF